MKMSEVFKLPLTWKRYLERGEPHIKIVIFDKSDEKLRGFFYNMNDEEVSAIIEAVNSHDTQLADIDRLLDLLRDIRDIAELNKHWSIPRIEELSDQTYTELREKYPKEEKDEV